jgi:hypothetical protein
MNNKKIYFGESSPHRLLQWGVFIILSLFVFLLLIIYTPKAKDVTATISIWSLFSVFFILFLLYYMYQDYKIKRKVTIFSDGSIGIPFRLFRLRKTKNTYAPLLTINEVSTDMDFLFTKSNIKKAHLMTLKEIQDLKSKRITNRNLSNAQFFYANDSMKTICFEFKEPLKFFPNDEITPVDKIYVSVAEPEKLLKVLSQINI